MCTCAHQHSAGRKWQMSWAIVTFRIFLCYNSAECIKVSQFTDQVPETLYLLGTWLSCSSLPTNPPELFYVSMLTGQLAS